MENTNEYMTKEKIEAIVAKRVFGLFYGDEWSEYGDEWFLVYVGFIV